MSDTYQAVNPATDEVLETYQLMSRDEAEKVIEQCHAAFGHWRTTSFEERSEILRQVARLIRERKDQYAELMTREMGKTLAQGRQECDLCAAICEYTADQGPEVLKDQEREIDGGRAVAQRAAKVLKKTVLELGSNDAYLILADADLEKAVKYCVQGRVYNTGQTCVAAKRFIVEDAIYDKFRDAYLEQMKKVSFGDPTRKETAMGPMARKDLRDGLHEQVRRSVDNGATCLLGGEIPEGKGSFYPATVLEDVAPGQPAYDEELFGPVASLIRVKDAAEAVKVANDSIYGLGGGIFSENESRAIDMARNEFDTGMVNVNGYNLALPNIPFGGVKDSGYGREHGGFGMHEFVNVKAVLITG